MVYYAPACTPLTHLLHAAPPLPGRDRSRSRCTRDHMCPPVAHVTMVPLTSGPDRRLPGLYRTIVGSSSTCSLRASQWYQPRAVHRSSCPPGFESRVPIHVRPPLLTSTLCPRASPRLSSTARAACMKDPKDRSKRTLCDIFSCGIQRLPSGWLAAMCVQAQLAILVVRKARCRKRQSPSVAPIRRLSSRRRRAFEQ